MKYKNVIVFGGSGFLGSHICDHLTDKGYKVTIFDRKRSKYKKKNQKMCIGDITNFKTVNLAIKNKNYVYHFAGVSDIQESNSYPLKAIKFNIMGTTNILEALKKQKKIKRLIFASSIYARSKQGGFYSSTKRSCESLIEEYSNIYKIQYNILRFGSLYGSRANSFNTIYNIIDQSIKEKKIERDGDGMEIRNYINVTDAAKICIELLKKKYSNQYFDIVGKEKVSVKSVINLISKKLSIKKIIYNKNKIQNYHYKINPYTYKVRKAKILKMKKSIKLEDGINDIIKNLI
tara:strand:- start:225 stop:1094 length:870 start_codon:yes stop_codon:yes gene_type:complete